MRRAAQRYWPADGAAARSSAVPARQVAEPQEQRLQRLEQRWELPGRQGASVTPVFTAAGLLLGPLGGPGGLAVGGVALQDGGLSGRQVVDPGHVVVAAGGQEVAVAGEGQPGQDLPPGDFSRALVLWRAPGCAAPRA